MPYKDTQLQRAAQARHQAGRVEQVNALKRVPCADCGIQYHPEVMEFDHPPDSGKVANVSVLLKTRAIAVVLAEAAKCEVVCANCHRMRTVNRRQNANRLAH